jgi:hypothetical protein
MKNIYLNSTIDFFYRRPGWHSFGISSHRNASPVKKKDHSIRVPSGRQPGRKKGSFHQSPIGTPAR